MENVNIKKGKYEARDYDSSGRVTGLINGEIKEEIPDSIYNEETGDVIIMNSKDSYIYEIYDIEEGNYKMEHSSIVNGRPIIFKAQNIPIYLGQTHRYEINWGALARGEDGTSISIDLDSDVKFEKTINSDIKLSCEEFYLQIEK
ncbi:hypothetical protein K0B03_03045 [Patescibacteria group bacterium]|nr:hypothetical protein [Patescibacteria group bacterium]